MEHKYTHIPYNHMHAFCSSSKFYLLGWRKVTAHRVPGRCDTEIQGLGEIFLGTHQRGVLAFCCTQLLLHCIIGLVKLLLLVCHLGMTQNKDRPQHDPYSMCADVLGRQAVVRAG
jgi:hypothetical protein